VGRGSLFVVRSSWVVVRCSWVVGARAPLPRPTEVLLEDNNSSLFVGRWSWGGGHECPLLFCKLLTVRSANFHL
jgi:hypothetical protein